MKPIIEALQWIEHHALQEGCSRDSLKGVAKQGINFYQSLSQPNIKWIEIKTENKQKTINYHKDLWVDDFVSVTYQKELNGKIVEFLKVKHIEYEKSN